MWSYTFCFLRITRKFLCVAPLWTVFIHYENMPVISESICFSVCTSSPQAPAAVRFDLLLDFKDSPVPEQQVYVSKGWGTQSRRDSQVVHALKLSEHWNSLKQWLGVGEWGGGGREKKRRHEWVTVTQNSAETRNVCTDNLCKLHVSHSYCSAACCKTCCYYMLYWHVYYFPKRKSLLWPAFWSCWVLYSSPGHFKNTSWKNIYKSDTWQKKRSILLYSAKPRLYCIKFYCPHFNYTIT